MSDDLGRESHNTIAPRIAVEVLQAGKLSGKPTEQTLILLESVILGVLLQLTKGDSTKAIGVAGVLSEGVIHRIAEKGDLGAPRPSTAKPLRLVDWVGERLANCERIAATKTGAIRQGWLEDARYFRAILAALGTQH